MLDLNLFGSHLPYDLPFLLITYHRTITAMTWNPHNPDEIATASVEGKVSTWNIETGDCLCSIRLPDEALAMDWDPHNPTRICASLKDACVYALDVSEQEGNLIKMFSRVRDDKGKGVCANVVRWNPRDNGILAGGNTDGSLSLYDGSKSRLVKLTPKSEKPAVADLQWDELSNIYLLAAYRNGAIVLWDCESQSELHSFDRQGSGLTALSWMPWASGNFATVTDRNGNLRVWNVSQPQPLEVLRVGTTGFTGLVFMPGTPRALCVFDDGSVCVYNIRKKYREFVSNPAHTETIFDIDYDPTSPTTLATASYDATVKVWHTPTMDCLTTLDQRDGVIYGLSWSPSGDRIATCDADGYTSIWDVSSAKRLHKHNMHRQKPVYRIDWNKLNQDHIATGG